VWNVIPGTLDLKSDYTAAISNEANYTVGCSANLTGCTGKQAVSEPAVVWPDERNRFQRFNAFLIYYVDPSVVKQVGLVGNVNIKLRYTWEQNRNSNWAINDFAPYSPSPADAGGVDITNGGSSWRTTTRTTRRKLLLPHWLSDGRRTPLGKAGMRPPWTGEIFSSRAHRPNDQIICRRTMPSKGATWRTSWSRLI
jgi:hypothetical protein